MSKAKWKLIGKICVSIAALFGTWFVDGWIGLKLGNWIGESVQEVMDES